MSEWNAELKCLVDYMGIPISRSEAQEELEAIKAHLLLTPVQLAALAKSVLTQQYPHMVKQQDLSPERFS